jgi:predicted PurR-regulated permease PerM
MAELRNPPNHAPPRARRIILQSIGLVAVSLLLVWLLYALRAVLLLLAFTIIFCYLIAPLVDFVERPLRVGGRTWRLPRAVAITLVYLLLAALLVLLFDQLIPLLSEQLSALVDNTPVYVRQLYQYSQWVTSLPNRYRLPAAWRQSISDWLNTLLLGVGAWLQIIAVRTVQLTLFLPWLLLIPIIGFFFLKDARAVSSKVLASLPTSDMRYRVTIFLKDVSATLAGYIRAQLLACIIVGVIEGLGLWLLGVPYALVLAVLAGVLEFIPIIGPLVLGIIAALVASFDSWHAALLVTGFLALFRIIHDYVIYPRLVSQGVEIHPVVVVLAVLSGAELGGVTGVFLSVPLTALLLVCWRHWRDLRLDRSAQISKSDAEPLLESILIEE